MEDIQDDNYIDPADFLYNEAEYLERKASRIRQAADMIANDDFDDDNFNNENNSNHGNRDFNGSQFSGRGGNNGNRNFATDDDDARTVEGRQSHDANQFSRSELQQFIRDRDPKYMHEDGESFDRRTSVGRALYAAGLIDDDGNLQGGGSGRGRSSGSNTGRGRTTASNSGGSRGRGSNSNSGGSGRGRSSGSGGGRNSR